MKLHYLIIPIAVLAVALVGSFFTNSGMAWYQTLQLPPWTPPGSIIGTVWTILFIMIAASAILVFNCQLNRQHYRILLALFLLNALLNILWSYLFFGQKLMFAAFLEVLLLEDSILALIIFIRPLSRVAALLLVPYAAWVIFAAYLNYLIFVLNF